MGPKKKKSIKDYTPEELVKKAKDNHIWLNGFSCILPTDKFKQELGQQILDMLNHTDMSDSLGISNMIILTINKS